MPLKDVQILFPVPGQFAFCLLLTEQRNCIQSAQFSVTEIFSVTNPETLVQTLHIDLLHQLKVELARVQLLSLHKCYSIQIFLIYVGP